MTGHLTAITKRLLGFTRSMVVILLAWAMLVGTAWAGPKVRGDAVDQLASVPARAKLVVVVEDLEGAWDTPAIGTALSTIQAATDLSDTLAAWSVLAKRLDLSPDEAAKRLLGRRFVFVSDQEDDADAWAVAMVVAGETADLLRQRLDPVPRSLRDGLPVLAIENNAFEIVVHDRSNRRLNSSMSAGLRGDEAIVVLGPSSRSGLFDALLGSALGVGARVPTMDSTRPGKIARALPDGTGIVVVRGEPDNEHAWFVLGAALDDHAIRMNFLRENPELAASRVPTVKPWRLDLFDRAAADAVFAVAEVDALTASGTEVLTEAIGANLFGRVVMPAEGTLAGRSMLMGFASEEGPLDVVGVFETPEMVRGAIEMDRSVAESLRAIFPQGIFEDFGGLFPNAIRRVDLRDAVRVRSEAVLEALWPEQGPTMAWTVRSSSEPGGGGSRGWVILGLGEQRVSEVAGAMFEVDAAVDQKAALPWVSVFEIRPRLMIEALAGEKVALPPVLQALGAVERVRAQTLAAKADLLRGGGIIEFVRQEPTPNPANSDKD